MNINYPNNMKSIYTIITLFLIGVTSVLADTKWSAYSVLPSIDNNYSVCLVRPNVGNATLALTNLLSNCVTNNQPTVTVTTLNATTVTGNGASLTGICASNVSFQLSATNPASGQVFQPDGNGGFTVGTVASGTVTTLQTVFGACVDSGLALPSGSDYIAIGGNIATANADTDETRIRCAAGFIGTITNLQVYFNITSIAMGSGTNVFARFFTNGVLCNSIGLTYLGTSATAVQVGTNSGTGSLYIANKTNMLSLCLSNNTAGSVTLPRGGYSFQILNEQ